MSSARHMRIEGSTETDKVLPLITKELPMTESTLQLLKVIPISKSCFTTVLKELSSPDQNLPTPVKNATIDSCHIAKIDWEIQLPLEQPCPSCAVIEFSST